MIGDEMNRHHPASSGNRYRGPRTARTTPPANDRRVTSTAPPRKPLQWHTLAEAAKHCAADDAWAVIDEQAYDAARFADKRPGGVTDVGCYRTMLAWNTLLWLGGLFLSLCFERALAQKGVF